MLRALVIALLIANLVFFGWSRGWLDNVVGIRARGDREPERLASQVRPDSIVILPARGKSVPAATGISCVEAGPFAPDEIAAAESALQGIAPSGSWTDVRTEKPGTWLVYMGSYTDRAALLRKIEEIGRRRIEIEEVTLPSEGEFGLSLGRFDDRGNAERALAQFMQRGIRTARVVQASAPSVTHTLRIEHADPTLTAQLLKVKTDVLGKAFAPCSRNEAAR
jgi:hypothetical protein